MAAKGQGARPDTWMPLYWGDYLRDTMHLRAEGHGAYMLLIGAYWMRGEALPDDDEFLAAVARLDMKAWRKHRPTVAAFFDVGDGLWRHRRIDAELAEAHARTEAKRKAGSAGGTTTAIRKQSGSIGTSDATSTAASRGTSSEAAPLPSEVQQRGQRTGTQSQSQSQKSTTATPTLDPARGDQRLAAVSAVFTEVWGDPHYPASGAMVQAWIDGGADLHLDILPAIRRQMARFDGRPPDGLGAFTKSIRRAVEERKRGTAQMTGSTSPDDEAREATPEERARLIACGFGSEPDLPWKPLWGTPPTPEEIAAARQAKGRAA